MIPKIIHYCWFGETPLPDNVKRCIASWESKCPEYKIVQWNEKNYDVFKNAYTKKTYTEKNYAFLSDYARLDIIYNNGGIYLDTDVEVLKKFDDLLNHKCFFGCETKGRVATGLGFGAEKFNPVLLANMNEYTDLVDYKKFTCVDITTNLLFKKYGFDYKQNEIQQFKDFIVYPPEYFCPYSILTRKMRITEKTYSIHHYDASWKNDTRFEKILGGRITSVKIFIKEIIDNSFGIGTYSRIKQKIKK
ncbi:glycosyltransferase family 32 protein [Enterococcus bulliens]